MNRVSHKTGRRGRRTVAAVAAMLVAGGLAAAPLAADATRSGELRATGLASNGTKLVRFDTDRPSSVSRSERIAGLSGDSRLIGIDFRVQNGRLYGVGNAGGIYLIGSGASASKVGQLSVGLTGTNFGVDFNPAANALRVISDTGQNLRQPFGTGDAPTGATAADGTLTYPATPTTPATTATGVTGAAYTNNDLDPDTATTLFDIDTRLDQVVLQVPANAGTLSPTGKLGDRCGRQCRIRHLLHDPRWADRGRTGLRHVGDQQPLPVVLGQSAHRRGVQSRVVPVRGDRHRDRPQPALTACF